MDTLTHLVLGAVTGECIARRRLGRNALFYGAAANVLPDIDVVAALWLDPADNVVFHRGITHSIIVVAVFAALLGLVTLRYRRNRETWYFWFSFLLIQFSLHLFVDVFNAYGAGLLQPFTDVRISFHTLYVVDPLFSVWLVIAAALVLLLRNEGVRRRIAFASLGLSALYLVSAIAGRQKVSEAAERALADEGISYRRVLITPTPLNSWLWFVAAEADDGYYLNYISVFHPDKVPEFHFTPHGRELSVEIKDQSAYRKLADFSDGFYTLSREGDALMFNHIGFGQIAGWRDAAAPFAFHYYLNGTGDNRYVMQRGRFSSWDGQTVHILIRRTFSGR